MDIPPPWPQTLPHSMGEPAIVKIYTRKGDRGETSLYTGARVGKDCPNIDALGDVDELVAALGLAKAEIADADLAARVTTLQGELYLLMADLAAPGDGEAPASRLPADVVPRLESWIDEAESHLPPLKDFVMPGDARASAAMHLARAVCRRAERHVVAARRESAIPEAAVVYLNRLSDLLFVLARRADQLAGGADKTFKSTLE